jgi:hypothetical protein
MLILLLFFQAFSIEFVVNSIGHKTFRMAFNDSIRFIQSGFESFLVFDSFVGNSVTFDSTSSLSIPYWKTSISVSDSRRLFYLKNVSTTVSVFTVSLNRCSRSSQSITGISRMNFTIELTSGLNLCIFPISTNYSEVIRVDPPGVSTFVLVNGSEREIVSSSLTTVTPFYIIVKGVSRFTIDKVHWRNAEMNWNFCEAEGFLFISDNGSSQSGGDRIGSIGCFQNDFDVAPADGMDVIIWIVVLFVATIGIPLSIQIPLVRRQLGRLLPRNIGSDGSLTGYQSLGSAPPRSEAERGSVVKRSEAGM